MQDWRPTGKLSDQSRTAAGLAAQLIMSPNGLFAYVSVKSFRRISSQQMKMIALSVAPRLAAVQLVMISAWKSSTSVFHSPVKHSMRSDVNIVTGLAFGND